jgi:lysozyme family protein
MNFDQAFTLLLGHEGGYSNHPNDPGGETMWGVTAKVARAAGYTGPMRDLPVSTAKSIYRRLYWDPVRADELPEVVRYAVFDAAVNSGISQARRWLQRAVGVADDGSLGPITMAAVQAAQPEVLLRRLLAQRLQFMTDLSTWPSFGRGWARRIASLLGA